MVKKKLMKTGILLMTMGIAHFTLAKHAGKTGNFNSLREII